MIIPCDDPVSTGAQRFGIFTGAGQRRDWPPEVKASIVAECDAGGEGVGAVARRRGLDPSQVYGWRKDLRTQLAARVRPVHWQSQPQRGSCRRWSARRTVAIRFRA